MNSNYLLGKESYSFLIRNYLDSKNITKNTINDFDIQEIIINTLLNTKNIEQFTSLIVEKKYFNLLSCNNKGNLIEIVNKHTGINSDTLSRILSLTGIKNGRFLGKGEIFIAMFFSDVLLNQHKSDLIWNSLNLEVKGSGGRFGDRNKHLSKNCIIYNKIEKKGVQRRRIDNLILNTVDFNDFIEKNYYIKPEVELSTKRKTITYYYTLNYIQRKNIDKIILINTTTNKGIFKIIDTSSLKDLIEQEELYFKPFFTDDIHPSLNTIK